MVKRASATHHAPESNIPRSRGRAFKGVCAAGDLELSAVVETVTTDAGCRLYDIGLHLPNEDHEPARLHASKRLHMRRALERKVVCVDLRPPQRYMSAQKWLREHISSTKDSDRVKRNHPLVLSRSLFKNDCISAESRSVAMLWVMFWAAARACNTFSNEKGFGLRAVQKAARRRNDCTWRGGERHR